LHTATFTHTGKRKQNNEQQNTTSKEKLQTIRQIKKFALENFFDYHQRSALVLTLSNKTVYNTTETNRNKKHIQYTTKI